MLVREWFAGESAGASLAVELMPVEQPGGRDPAPGELALLQAFINTHYDLVCVHGAEVLASPEALRDWLCEHALIEPGARVGPRSLQRALAVREALRALARNGTTDGDALRRLDRAARGAAFALRFSPLGPRFRPASRGGTTGALGVLLAITARAMLDGSWAHLKVCPGDDCGWLFYDRSRNQAGRWCSMSVCGGRAKARAHYQRRGGIS